LRAHWGFGFWVLNAFFFLKGAWGVERGQEEGRLVRNAKTAWLSCGEIETQRKEKRRIDAYISF
ncbi:unnamed protein product, partial [Ectocarpus sp. 12 AP-2014]